MSAEQKKQELQEICSKMYDHEMNRSFATQYLDDIACWMGYPSSLAYEMMAGEARLNPEISESERGFTLANPELVGQLVDKLRSIGRIHSNFFDYKKDLDENDILKGLNVAGNLYIACSMLYLAKGRLGSASVYYCEAVETYFSRNGRLGEEDWRMADESMRRLEDVCLKDYRKENIKGFEPYHSLASRHQALAKKVAPAKGDDIRSFAEAYRILEQRLSCDHMTPDVREQLEHTRQKMADKIFPKKKPGILRNLLKKG